MIDNFSIGMRYDEMVELTNYAATGMLFLGISLGASGLFFLTKLKNYLSKRRKLTEVAE